jgi:hypothetical protein
MTATFPFSAPPIHRLTTSIQNRVESPKATMERVTPRSPIIRTGLRPMRSESRPQKRTVVKVVKAKRDSYEVEKRSERKTRRGGRGVGAKMAGREVERKKESETYDEASIVPNLLRIVRNMQLLDETSDERENEGKSDRLRKRGRRQLKV